jgi:uncharacterized protein YgiM (DUF1202 family)
VSAGARKVLKGIGGGLAILLLVITVARWYGDFRIAATDKVLEDAAAPAQGEGSETTDGGSAAEDVTTEPAQTDSTKTDSKPATKTVIVLTDGLNFRDKPKKGATVIRGLDKGEKLVLIEEADGWYHVKTSDGTEGYISASPSYSKVE